MEKLSYKLEATYLDKYMDAKNSGQSGLDTMIEKIIVEFLIPQSRLVEANAWLEPIEDSKLSARIKQEIAKAESVSNIAVIKRLPKNKDWVNADIFEKIKTTNDQQYHYNRLICYLNINQSLLDDRDDIFECRNEWITYMSYSTYGLDAKSAIVEAGIEFTTLAMAWNDYIEYILLPDKFVEIEGTQEPEKPIHQTSNYITVEKAYSNYPDTISYLKEHSPQILNEKYLMNFFSFTKILGSQEEILITDQHLCFLPGKKKGWLVGSSNFLPINSITEVSVGSEYHIEHQGFVSTESAYWTVTFQTSNFQSFTRYLYLGKNENEMNRNKPEVGQTLQRLGQIFELVEGNSYTSTGGYTTSFGYGWWIN